MYEWDWLCVALYRWTRIVASLAESHNMKQVVRKKQNNRPIHSSDDVDCWLVICETWRGIVRGSCQAAVKAVVVGRNRPKKNPWSRSQWRG